MSQSQNRYEVKITDQHIRAVIIHAFESSPSFRNVLYEVFGKNIVLETDLFIQHKTLDNGVVNTVYSLELFRGRDQEQPHGPCLELILKLSSPNWKYLKTLNEVHVMKVLHSLQLPNLKCPQIFTYDTSADFIGYEYILMEKCRGVALSEIYETLSFHERKGYINQIAKIRGELSSLKLLMVDENDQELKEPELLFGSIQEMQVIDQENKLIRVKIGPNCDTKNGPFNTFNEYLIKTIEYRMKGLNESLIELGSSTAISHYKELFNRVIHYLRRNAIKVRRDEFQLCHYDLTPNNTLIDPHSKTITGVIDWEWACLTVLDEDMNEILNNWALCDEEKEYVKTCLNSEIDFLSIDVHRCEDYWKSHKERTIFFDAASWILRLTCYKEWFLGKPYEVLLEYVQGIKIGVEKFFEEHEEWNSK
ncbi:hypothetical protein C9374_003175 [Naegleria lovaniensis]|uniref:Aminoglycoside phosphotransferase domain-containing protein n=1 Tax=Naegleria lovaniensis TaxID=51637 RepID=A0AA88GPN4_NAELO|nr:uncharacterized protein C9374_003175 [Naegleria lovaniensis]KAG2386026.1 hypothetical protein C9374_003175 [Naegleria lovaniensis]